MARGVLLHPNGERVTSRQQQPWPMAAMLRGYRLEPQESQPIAVALSLMPDEVAALIPGRYRLTDVRERVAWPDAGEFRFKAPGR